MQHKHCSKPYFAKVNPEKPSFARGMHHPISNRTLQSRFTRRELKLLYMETHTLRIFEWIHREYADDLFSYGALYSAVALRVVNRPPENWWNDFHRSFATYWDGQLGVGGTISLDQMTHSIQRKMWDKCWQAPTKQIRTFCRFILEYLETEPGVILHDPEPDALPLPNNTHEAPF